MVQSLNTRADLTAEAIAYLGFPKYGQVMMGDKAFEFYNEKNTADTMSFPWASVKRVEAYVSHSGKIDKNFYIVLNNNKKIRFNSIESGKILKLFREQIGNEKVTRISSLTSSFLNVFKKKK